MYKYGLYYPCPPPPPSLPLPPKGLEPGLAPLAPARRPSRPQVRYFRTGKRP